MRDLLRRQPRVATNWQRTACWELTAENDSTIRSSQNIRQRVQAASRQLPALAHAAHERLSFWYHDDESPAHQGALEENGQRYSD